MRGNSHVALASDERFQPTQLMELLTLFAPSHCSLLHLITGLTLRHTNVEIPVINDGKIIQDSRTGLGGTTSHVAFSLLKCFKW